MINPYIARVEYKDTQFEALLLQEQPLIVKAMRNRWNVYNGKRVRRGPEALEQYHNDLAAYWLWVRSYTTQAFSQEAERIKLKARELYPTIDRRLL